MKKVIIFASVAASLIVGGIAYSEQGKHAANAAVSQKIPLVALQQSNISQIASFGIKAAPFNGRALKSVSDIRALAGKWINDFTDSNSTLSVSLESVSEPQRKLTAAESAGDEQIKNGSFTEIPCYVITINNAHLPDVGGGPVEHQHTAPTSKTMYIVVDANSGTELDAFSISK